MEEIVEIIENATQIMIIEGKRNMEAFLKGNVIGGGLTESEADEIEKAIDEYYANLLKKVIS